MTTEPTSTQPPLDRYEHLLKDAEQNINSCEKSIQYAMSWLQRAQTIREFIQANSEKFKILTIQHNIKFMCTNFGLSIHALDRDQYLAVRNQFPGKYSKDVEGDKISYVLSMDNDFEIIITNVPPPTSCKIIEETVEIPATTKTVRKIVCPNGKDIE